MVKTLTLQNKPLELAQVCCEKLMIKAGLLMETLHSLFIGKMNDKPGNTTLMVQMNEFGYHNQDDVPHSISML